MYNDEQLKQALAKMLPELLEYILVDNRVQDGPHMLCWVDRGYTVRDTELLHLCWLVEETLSSYAGEYGEELSQKENYSELLLKQVATWKDNFHWGSECIADFYQVTHATWQQRVIALAQVKGIEIV